LGIGFGFSVKPEWFWDTETGVPELRYAENFEGFSSVMPKAGINPHSNLPLC
jgi:hypothetical protein